MEELAVTVPPERAFCGATPGGSRAMAAIIATAACSSKMRLTWALLAPSIPPPVHSHTNLGHFCGAHSARLNRDHLSVYRPNGNHKLVRSADEKPRLPSSAGQKRVNA